MAKDIKTQYEKLLKKKQALERELEKQIEKRKSKKINRGGSHV